MDERTDGAGPSQSDLRASVFRDVDIWHPKMEMWVQMGNRAFRGEARLSHTPREAEVVCWCTNVEGGRGRSVFAPSSICKHCSGTT